MKFKTVTEFMGGSSKMGAVEVSYDTLVATFGQPVDCFAEGSDDGKVQVEWRLLFEDGARATIHDYRKSGSPQAITDWSVGGYGPEALTHVVEALGI